MKNYDVIVVGGGPMGLATAAELTKSDKQTLLIEKFNFINQNGSSAGLSRQFRVQYAQKYMAQLALDAIPYWEALQQTTNDVLVDKVGSVWFGDPALSSQEGGIQAAKDTMDSLDIPYTSLNTSEIEKQYPFTNIPSNYEGFRQDDGGIIDLKATQIALLEICKNSPNVTLRNNSQVTNIDSLDNGDIIVTVNDESFITKKLVLSPGAYINDVLKHFELSVDINIWEMSSAYYKKLEDITLPTWFVFQKPTDKSLFYGFPEVDWAHPGYIRVAPDIPDRIIKDPSKRSPNPNEESLKLNEAWVRDHMKGLSSKSEFTSTCLITLSTDSKELLLLDTLPSSINNNENIIVYTGGWAAKFVPLLGKILSDLALTGATSFDISEFKINYLKSSKKR